MNTSAMNIDFIVAAYSVMWVVVLGYLVRLIRKGGRARTDYDDMLREQGGGRS
jgi:CcmD family protein